jgi:hypothetical protein
MRTVLPVPAQRSLLSSIVCSEQASVVNFESRCASTPIALASSASRTPVKSRSTKTKNCGFWPVLVIHPSGVSTTRRVMLSSLIFA